MREKNVSKLCKYFHLQVSCGCSTEVLFCDRSTVLLRTRALRGVAVLVCSYPMNSNKTLIHTPVTHVDPVHDLTYTEWLTHKLLAVHDRVFGNFIH